MVATITNMNVIAMSDNIVSTKTTEPKELHVWTDKCADECPDADTCRDWNEDADPEWIKEMNEYQEKLALRDKQEHEKLMLDIKKAEEYQRRKEELVTEFLNFLDAQDSYWKNIYNIRYNLDGNGKGKQDNWTDFIHKNEYIEAEIKFLKDEQKYYNDMAESLPWVKFRKWLKSKFQ